MSVTRSLARVLLVSFLVLTAVSAQQPTTPGPDIYSRLHWRTIGPEGNRFSAAAGIPGDPLTYYVGAASGGIWKTTDGGVNWAPLFDDQPVQSIGSLAVAQSDPQHRLGRHRRRQDPQPHLGRAGRLQDRATRARRWKLMGLEQTGRIPRTRHPPEGPEHRAGLRARATPTGRSRSAASSAPPTAARPGPRRSSSTRTPAARTSRWIRRTRASSSPACGSSRSTPGDARAAGRAAGCSCRATAAPRGRGWRATACRRSPVGKVAVAIAPSNPNRVYAMIETGDGVPWKGQPTDRGQLWRSDDGGDTWQVVSYDRNAMGRAHYYSRMAVAPDNENEAYFLTASYSKSIDGGADAHRAAAAPKRPGGDHHDIWIDPTNANRQIVAHDQGLSITVNRGKTWFRQRLNNAQIYHVTVDNEIPYNVLGNKQDEPTYRGPSNSRLQGGFGGARHPARDVALGGRRRERLGHARPHRLEHHLVHGVRLRHGRRHRRALRGEPAAVPQRRGVAGPVERPGRGRAVPLRVGRAAADLAARPQHGLRRQPARAPHHQRRPELAGDQPGPDAERQVAHGELGRPDARQHRRRVRGRRLRHRRVAAREGPDLGRHQRRPGAAHARRRQDVDERDEEPAGPAGVGLGAQHRAVALRRRHRVPDGGLPPGEQPRPVRLPDHRLRRDVEADRQRHPEEHAELRQGDLRGSRAARHALPRHRERDLRVVRRRRHLAAAAERPAARAGVGHRRAGALQRPGDLHLRPRLLDHGRHHARCGR